jgi:Ca2+/H+ antiporter, TMEM165/GDT1 family
MHIDWVHAWPPVTAAFLASLVEFVEALTVVLAVGTGRGWSGALIGTGGALTCLLAVVLGLGPALGRIPLAELQLAVGILLVLFGMRWLRKAVLRSAGVIPLHDEDTAYARQTASLRQKHSPGRGWDAIAVATSFKITLLEGLEVVFIVIAVGAGGAGLLVPASIGAAAALLVVIVLGVLLHRPLSAVPENTIKFAVGVLLAAFGTFWIGEGIGVQWPGDDWAILGLTAAFGVVSIVLIAPCRRRAGACQATPARGTVR